MRTRASRSFPIHPGLILIDGVGTLLAALGLAGLFIDLSSIFPFMANRDVAGMIAGVGFALMTFAMLKIVQGLRSRRLQGPQ